MHNDYLFTDEMKSDFICHPTADAPRFYIEGETLSDVYGKHSSKKEEGHISFFTEYSEIAEYYNGVNGVNNA